ncbi:MAG: carboxypeptidase-like regulatory domain-containing protein [Chloroflexales bacterium]|nr:carboxypeptidase-like regulatory domain-containing protein [Chloroflexales bacterium]
MKRRFLCAYICFILAIVSLAGCATTAPATPTPNAPIQAGMALLRGRLLTSQGVVIANRAVHLAPIYGEGDQQAYVFDSSTGVGSVTDANGGFVMVNIPPGRYVFLVVVSEGLTAALLDKAGNEKIWELKADQLQDIGDAKVNLP